MEPITVLRALGRTSVCVLLDTGAVVQAELQTPLSPRTHVNAQRVNALTCVPGMILLGPYDLEQNRFTQCVLDANWPEAVYSRLNYSHRSKKNN